MRPLSVELLPKYTTRYSIISLIAVATVARALSATIVLSPTADSTEIESGKELKRIWTAATGDTDEWIFELSSSPIADSDPDSFRIKIAPRPSSIPPRSGVGLAATHAAFAVILHGATPQATRFGVNWFCAHYLGARWFIPGPLGEVIPQLAHPPTPDPIDQIVTPAFKSREFFGLGTNGKEWEIRNGLLAHWTHAHALVHIIPYSLGLEHPDWFPLLEGKRYIPLNEADSNWQPNLANPEVVDQTAAYVASYFQTHRNEQTVSLSVNDSIRFDQSSITETERGPLRWFRGRPDYSNLVFGFMNRVADKVGRLPSNKMLSAYAYYWCENTPSFPVRPNILPWLTADRTQWFDPDFARQDKALILRWSHSGVSTFGLYDYLYGSPFLVPRVPVHLIAQSIQFGYKAGARGYFAECYPHWSFDGPKLWMTAQLLWDPNLSPKDLLDEYYSTFFGNAAPDMRDFYAICESAWLNQPRPGRWIKYFRDADQAALFRPNLRARLKAKLTSALKRAESETIRNRVAMVAAGFRVTDEFCAYVECKIVGAEASAIQSRSAELEISYTRARDVGAMAQTDLSGYLRILPGKWSLASQTASQTYRRSLLGDPLWTSLMPPKSPSADTGFLWSAKGGPWIARGEPTKDRQITLSSNGPSVTVSGIVAEGISQWVVLPKVVDRKFHYRAEVSFAGKVSAGNESFLIVSFLSRSGHYSGPSPEARVFPGLYKKPIRLVIDTIAPEDAEFIGYGIYVYHQNAGDLAQFSKPDLWVF